MGWYDFGFEDLGMPSYDAYDFSMPEDFGGGYDFGQIEVPDWGGWQGELDFSGGEPWGGWQGELDFSGGEPFFQQDAGLFAPDLPMAEGQAPMFAGDQGYTYNTTTGAVTPPSGVPAPGGGGAAPPAGGDPGFAAARAALDAAQGRRPGGAPTGPPPGGQGPINDFLGTNLGRIAGATGVGLLGLGAQQILAGGTPRYTPPTFTPSPGSVAGQRAVLNALEGGAGPALTEAMTAGVGGQRDIARQVAERVGRETLAEQEMAPGERGIRMASLADIQRLMAQGAETPIVDPIEQAIREELMGVLRGGATGVSPATGRRQSLEEQEVRARLYRQLGPDYELTTPGIQTLNEMKQRHNTEQYTERQATITRLSPLEQGRMQFSTTAPVNLLANREGLRRANLGDVERLSQFGVRGAPQNVTTLNSIVPTATLLGGDPNRANEINTQLQAGAAQAAFSGETARRANLSRGIGDIAGVVAGSIAARPSRLDQYYDNILAGSRGYGGYGGG